MKLLNQLVLVGLFMGGGVSVVAQTAETDVKRDVNQQERIEQGLQSGALTTKEAAHLEQSESYVNRLESRAQKDGVVTADEAARISAQQNKVSGQIHQQKHDAQLGNPDSASSQRLQKDVQRNANQEARIGQGLSSGELSTTEAATLERGQARTTHHQAAAGADGHVGAGEQGAIQAGENHQSKRIKRKKHNDVVKPS
jgi:hypothetical protein